MKDEMKYFTNFTPKKLIEIENKHSKKEEAIQLVILNGEELKNCEPTLQNNEEVVMAALKQDSWTLKYASAELKSNKTFILKALNEGVETFGLIVNTAVNIKLDREVMMLAVEKSHSGLEFACAKGEVALNKELAAKALVKWGNYNGIEDVNLLEELCPSIQEFFPKDCWYEKALAYLIQLEQEKQAEMVSGGSTAEDGVVW